MTVVRLEISERGPYQGGASFGEIGPYEYLAGVIHFAIDPSAAANGPIRDVDLAPTNARGQVEFSAQFHLLAPRDPPPDGRLLVDSPNRGNLTAHGFRSSFRDWAAERTNFSRAVCESALSHTLRDKTEAAYNRTDLLNRRRELIATWSAFATTKPGDIVSLRA